MVICLEQGADLHMAQLMSLPLTVSCFSKIQIGFTFMVPAYLGSPGQRAIKWVCVCVCYSHVHNVNLLGARQVRQNLFNDGRTCSIQHVQHTVITFLNTNTGT